MKRLHLVRHAEAGPARGRDHDRAITRRGRDAAGRLGTHLLEAGAVPDLSLCSTARRARETLEGINVPGVERRVERDLYEATADDLLARLREVPDTVRVVLLVGHNPGVQQLALALTGSPAAFERLAATFPAGSLATVDAPVDRWIDLGPGGELSRFVVPGELE